MVRWKLVDRLSNLKELILYGNEFVGDFVITKENSPTSIELLSLSTHKLSGFVRGKILTNLVSLALNVPSIYHVSILAHKQVVWLRLPTF